MQVGLHVVTDRVTSSILAPIGMIGPPEKKMTFLIVLTHIDEYLQSVNSMDCSEVDTRVKKSSTVNILRAAVARLVVQLMG